MIHYQKEAQKLLRELGVNGSYVGFWYTAFAIDEILKDPAMLTYICKGLYVEIAIHFHTTTASAERNIRTVKNIIWEHRDNVLRNQLFGNTAGRIPTNAVFLDILSQYVAERCIELV